MNPIKLRQKYLIEIAEWLRMLSSDSEALETEWTDEQTVESLRTTLIGMRDDEVLKDDLSVEIGLALYDSLTDGKWQFYTYEQFKQARYIFVGLSRCNELKIKHSRVSRELGKLSAIGFDILPYVFADDDLIADGLLFRVE